MFYCHRMKGEGVSKNADKYWVTPQSTHTQSQESLLLEGFSSIVLPTFRVWSKKNIFIRSFDFGHQVANALKLKYFVILRICYKSTDYCHSDLQRNLYSDYKDYLGT